MGVRVGNARLASEAVKCGAYGTIASVGLGDIEKSKSDFVNESNRVLREQILEARRLCGESGPLGINVMVALSNYESIVRESVACGVDFIISGAGLPISLPEYVKNPDIALIPVISGPRALKILLSAWKRRYKRKPDAVIVEAANCGGHLGFSMDQIENPAEHSLEKLYTPIKSMMEQFDCGSIPLVAAGAVASPEDIRRALDAGYSGVQIGTRFIAVDEAGIDRASKEVFVNAGNSEIVVIKSPVGLPVRVLKTPLVERVMQGEKEKFSCPYRCLRTCNPKKAPFCIAKALLSTWEGDVENGLYMCGNNIDSVDKIIPLKEFFDGLED